MTKPIISHSIIKTSDLNRADYEERMVRIEWKDEEECLSVEELNSMHLVGKDQGNEMIWYAENAAKVVSVKMNIELSQSFHLSHCQCMHINSDSFFSSLKLLVG